MQKLKHNISIWLLSIFGYIMLFDWIYRIHKEPDILTCTSNPLWPAPPIISINYTAYSLSWILFILLFIALIELGLKHYKNIGYDFDKPFINNPIIFFLFKLGFYLMFFPMTLVLTFTCVAIFINSFVLTLAWIMPGIIITIMIFWDIPIKTKFAKYGIASIFIIYTLIERLLCWLCYRY